jgi:sigma-B regulation protein RsbU (phosphoserine phosphatase)
MLVRKDRNRVERLSEGGPVLGLLPQARYSAGEIEISDRDTLILYTDGVSEAANESSEEFREERIRQTLLRAGDLTAARLCDQISREVTAFSGAEGSTQDDRTLLVVRFLSSETSSREYKLRAAMAEVV